MKKHNKIIAIDPDVEKSGVAYLNPSTRHLELSTLSFPQLLDYLQHVKTVQDQTKESVVIIVEAGWLISSNWHLKRSDNTCIASAKGNSTGRNHETGRKIVEMCRHYNFEVVEQSPLRKFWKGKDGKITHQELISFTGLIGKTNQEVRDAVLLAWNFANLPIKMKTKK